MKKLLAGLISALSLFCSPALAGIGVPAVLGGTSGTTGSSGLSFNTTADADIGDTIIIVGTVSNARFILTASYTDPTTSTVVSFAGYAQGSTTSGGVGTNVRGSIAYLYLDSSKCITGATHCLPLNTTINLTYSSTGFKSVTALKVSGLDPTTPYLGTASAIGTSTAPSVSYTPTYGETLLLGRLSIDGASTDTPVVEDTANGWADTAGGSSGIVSTARFKTGYQRPLGTLAVTRANTLSASRAWASTIFAFKAAPFVPPPAPVPYASRLRMARIAALTGGSLAYSDTPYANWAQTATLPSRGDPGDYGYSLPVIARVTTVPFQTFTAPFRLGALAYHAPTDADIAAGLYSNIDYATVSVDGGQPVRISEESVNPDTGTPDWNIEGNPALFSDGAHEARFTFYPKTGTPYTLQGSNRLVFSTYNTAPPGVTYYADATFGSDVNDCTAPDPAHACATIDRVKNAINTVQGSTAGGTIKLAAGSYVYGAATEVTTGNATPRWMTITPQDSVATGDVIIIGSGSSGQGLKTPRVRFSRIKFTGRIDAASGVTIAHWADNSIIDLGDRRPPCAATPTYPLVSGNNCIGFMNYTTNSTWSHARFGPVGQAIVRNVTVDDIGEDVLSGTGLSDNVTISNVDNSGTYGDAGVAHPDVYQFNGSSSNQIIIRNVVAQNNVGAQHYFEDNDPTTASNIALISSILDNQSGGAHSAEKVMQFGGPGYNWLWYGNTFVGATTWRQDFHFTADGLTLLNTTWATQNPGCAPTIPGVKCATVP